MAQRKGQTGNPNGRPVGSPNKTTAEIRNAFQLLVSNNIDTLQADLDSMKPTERVKAMLELMKFVLPTLRAVEITEERDFEGNQTINEITINIQHDGNT